MLPIAVLAGGLATRLGELTKATPKSLINIAGKPFIDWQFELLSTNGYTNVVLCLSHLSGEIQEHVGSGDRYGLKVTYSLDGEVQMGTGGAIKSALHLLGSKFAVLYGDSYLPINYREIEEEFMQSKHAALMTVYKNRNKFDKSNANLLPSGLVQYSKSANSLDWQYIDYGLSYFSSEVFDDFRANEPFDLAKVSEFLSENGDLLGFEAKSRFYEIGSIQGIKELSDYLSEANNEF